MNSEHGPIVDAHFLRLSGRDVHAPFRLLLYFDKHISELACTRVLRVLPGKRLVCLGEWNSQKVVVKVFLDRRRGDRHSKREQAGINALKNAEIRTPEILFNAFVSPDRTPIMGLQHIQGVQDMATAWERSESMQQRITLLNRAISLIAEQHQAGLKQDDLHLNNFLLTENDIYAIDGDAIDTRHTGKPLSHKKCLNNLALFFAQFDQSFHHLFPHALETYAKKRELPVAIDLSMSFTKKILSQRKRRKRKYLHKVYRECTAFVVHKTWDCRIICDRMFYTDAMAGFLSDPDTLIKSGRLLKDGHASTVALVEVDGNRLVVKRYNIKNLWHALRRLVLPSRASVSWRNAHQLTLFGIKTPKPIALKENRFGPFRRKAYFVSSYVEGNNAYHLIREQGAKAVHEQSMIDRFLALFQALSNGFFTHGDCKATNFIVTDNDIYITDLDAMRQHTHSRPFRRAIDKDLKRFMQNWEGLEAYELFREGLKKNGSSQKFMSCSNINSRLMN